MTAAVAPPSPAAVSAFLRGLERRARLFALVQAGHEAGARQALAVVAQVFSADAGQWPIAQWPGQYWRLLLAAPPLRQPAAADAGKLPLPGIARLGPEARAAVLLHLVAGLDDGEAAAALGIGEGDYQARIRDALPRDALGQPDVDVWRAWRAAAQRELARAPKPEGAPVRVAAAGAPADAGARRHRWRLRWLWLGVAACAVALAASFFLHPRGRELIDDWRAPIKREPLPPAEPPKARFDPADPALHPDRDLLASPREAAFARQLPLLAWLAQAGDDPELAVVLASPAAVDAAPTRQAPAAAGALERRIREWDRLPPVLRGERRDAWQAWRALAPAERIRLREVALRFHRLDEAQRQALRARFEALPADARHGWRLGPRLGRDWPRVAPLFAFARADERAALLRLLREATPEDVDALERLAQVTPPEQREQVRAELLGLPESRRRGWILARLQG